MTRTRTYSVKFRGKEVHNPVLRKLVATLLIVVGVPLIFAWLLLLLALSPAIVLLHLALRASGRRGFVVRTGTSSAAIVVNHHAFRRG